MSEIRLKRRWFGTCKQSAKVIYKGTSISIWKHRGLQRTYVDNTQDDGHLHLVRVGEDERVVRTMPARVQAEWVDMTIGHTLSCLVSREVPAGMEQMKSLGEDIVVDETSVDGESTHEQNNVATATCKVSVYPSAQLGGAH